MGNINVFSGPMKCGKSQRLISEANRQKMYDEQAAKIATAKIPSQFSGIDIMDSMKAEEARKKAELEALMQQQGVVSGLLNTDPHNI